MDLYNLVLSAKITKGEGGGGGDEPTGTKEITANGTYDVKSYASAHVDVPVPSGYIKPSGTKQISSNGSYDVSNFASAAVNISPTIESLSVTENGTYTAPSGVDGYSPVTVNVSGGGASLKPIVLRPDAELIAEYTYDKLIVEDEGITIPAYSTSAKTLKSSTNLDTISNARFDTYDYYGVFRFLAYPIYSSDTKYAGKFDYYYNAQNIELSYILNYNSLDKTKTSATIGASLKTFSNTNRAIYWNSASSIDTIGNTTYGTYTNMTSFLTTTTKGLSISSPQLMVRGYATYLNQTAWAEMTDIRYQYVLQLYRSEKGDLNVDGWGFNQNELHVLDCVNSADHTLT